MILLPKGSPLGGGMIPVVAENERPTCSYEVPDRRYNLWSAAAGLPGALPLPGLYNGFHYQETYFWQWNYCAGGTPPAQHSAANRNRRKICLKLQKPTNRHSICSSRTEKRTRTASTTSHTNTASSGSGGSTGRFRCRRHSRGRSGG